MGIQGNLSTMSLPDVLQWVGQGSQSGHLNIVNLDQRRTLYLDQGALISATSNDPRHRLPHVLAQRKLITERQQQLLRILHEAIKDPYEALIRDLNLLTANDLRQIITENMIEMVYELFTWNEGAFVFRKGQGEMPESFADRIELNQLIIEGCRRMDDWERFRTEIESDELVFRRTDSPAKPDDKSLSGICGILELLDGRKSLAEIIDFGAFSAYRVFGALYEAKRRGLVELVGRDTTFGRIRGVRSLVDLAHRLYSERAYIQALEEVDKALKMGGENEDVLELKRRILSAKRREIAELFGKNGMVPQVILLPSAPDFPINQITPQEGFVLSRINGVSSLSELMRISAVPKDQLLEALYKFHKLRIISLR